MKINNVHIITIDFDKVYIKEAVERIKNLNIEKNSKIIFGGVKGEVLTDDDLKNFIPYKNWNLKNSGNKFWDRELTTGEIGCVISHLKVWKQCVDNQTYPVLILEQDFNPVYNLNWEAFNEIENYDWDIIFLGHNNLDKQNKEIGFKNFIKPGYSYQAHAYILSESGLEKIKNYFQVLRFNLIPTDEFLPALYTKHPRPDVEAMYPNKINALALRVDAVIQNDWEGTGRSRTAPNDTQNFKVIENVITDDQIQFLLNYWDNIKCDTFTDINAWNSNLKTKTKIVAHNRIVEIVGIPKNSISFLTQILHNCFKQVINDFEMEYPHYFIYYPLGGKHTKHKDSSSGFNRDWVITLYLNDDFEGGELVINNQITPIKKGSAILYRGNTIHEVRPVLSGERYVINECARSK